MNRDPYRQLIDRLRREVVEEVRTAGLLGRLLPAAAPVPPADPEAEAGLIAAAWEGSWPTIALQPRHFYLHLHEAVWGALLAGRRAGLVPTVELVVKAVGKEGLRGREVEAAVRQLAEQTGVAAYPDRLAAVVLELARRRALIREMQAALAVLYEPAATAEQVAERLAAIDKVRSVAPARGGKAAA